ncbi:MAG: class I SAM-dependent methyltransferase [Candidatus Cloacimonetes bacterium]|nr:class I SAM-dependent methyltransferase [Candidatus Cloacimonadota bacterium]MBS3767370.1 class I SAM-dependent methyltransferase [Candidatus Cloacimonadota bacterium]
MTDKLYDYPKYYDIAFSWNITQEIMIYKKIFRDFVDFPVKKILEPACGSGRFLVKFAREGYEIVGYDNNRKMVDYTKRKVTEAGLNDKIKVVKSDMKTADFDIIFDAAINPINSIGYLHSDEEIVAHFCNTASDIRKGGVYVLHLSCAWEDTTAEAEDAETWSAERNGIKINTTWKILYDDKEQNLSVQQGAMNIDDNGKKLKLEETHVLRLWTYEDLKRLVKKSGKLSLKAIYNEDRQRLPLDTEIIGEMGNLFYVLKVI